MTYEKTIFRVIIRYDYFSFLLAGKGPSPEIFTWVPPYQTTPLFTKHTLAHKHIQTYIIHYTYIHAVPAVGSQTAPVYCLIISKRLPSKKV